MRFLLVVFCAAWTAFASGPAPRVKLAWFPCEFGMEVMGTALIWDRAVPVFGRPVTQDPFGSTAGKYVNPNEFNHDSLKPHLEGVGRTYIGLGTFRALNTAVMGGVDDVVLMDFDLGTAAFNRVNLALVATAKDRLEYLNLLFTGQRTGQILELHRAGEIDEHEFLWRISRFPNGGMKNLKLKALNLRLPEFSPFYSLQISEWSKRPGHSGQPLAPPRNIWDLFDQERFNVIDWIFRVPQFEKIPGLWKETYLGNDAHFATLQKLLKDGHVYVLCGDLAGLHTMQELAAALRASDKTVGLLDVSNAPEWIESEPPERRTRYFANLRALPWADSGVVLSTGGFRSVQSQDWGQSLVSHKKISEVEKLTTTRPTDPELLRSWISANDQIYGPGGPGKVHPRSIFTFR